MRLAQKPAPSGHNHHGDVHRVLRNGAELSAWSERAEAERALTEALAAEAAEERARLPANSSDGFQVTATSVAFEAGGMTMWRADYALDSTRGPRAVLSS